MSSQLNTVNKKNYNAMEECLSIQSIFIHIMQFLGSFNVEYKLVKRKKEDCHKKFKIAPERKIHGDKYVRHLKWSRSTQPSQGLGCPIVMFYLQNKYDNIFVYIQTISILNKCFKEYSDELFEFKSLSSRIINNILYKKAQLDFFQKYPDFVKDEHKYKCIKSRNRGRLYEGEWPEDCTNICKNNINSVVTIFCDRCNKNNKYIEDYPYMCYCNDYKSLDDYYKYSCDVCTVLNKDYVRGPPMWRLYKKCEKCKQDNNSWHTDNWDSD